ncbi:MAG: glutamine synthetase [Afipia sp.]|nr:glutamine synthetase [Afipia sp.]OUX63025.1 MAG: glutamine synthetase [Afipia sp. TMED4]HAO43030.1 glutamine synthetase [Afipia sp.]HAP09768.1 glutamine synthetase [Afipia sp.]HBF56240.1 glutamine synthetase [Afipia sp.]
MRFVEKHGLWSDAQKKAAEEVLARLEKENIQMVRLSWPDQYGLLRGKSLTVDALKAAFSSGSEITNGPFLFDTANALFENPFGKNMFSGTEMAGVGNIVMVPDPTTFKVLPWADRTGWLLADLYLRSGAPFPLSPRRLLKQAVADLSALGYKINAGLEVEFYLTRIIDPSLEPGKLGAPGTPSEPPQVSFINKGYSYLSENHLDEVEYVFAEIRRHLLALGLPLRSIEDEWAPGQFEITFDVTQGVDFADTMILFRSAVKQIARRSGHLASFMCWPGLPEAFPSGWHLHQSLSDVRSGSNLFVPEAGKPLSDIGRAWAGGLLANAAAASSFTTPTINGYRRRRANSLAPDRLSWAIDNRAAMLRVISNPGDSASRIENRVGEPAANPYLYLASQIYSGLDGIKRRLDPGPLQEDPYLADLPMLPSSLSAALDALQDSSLFREAFGEIFMKYWLTLRRSEWSRFIAAEGAFDTGKGVTAWEHREYFELL